jgi:uncharacterized protein YdaU (DUF1376 family)
MIRKFYSLDPAGGGGIVAPPAPAAPAPAAAPAPTPTVSPLQAMIAAKREALATGGTAGLFAAPATETPSATPPATPSQPRNPDGTFASVQPPATEPAAAATLDDAAPQDGDAPQDEPPPENALRVALPGRHPNAPDVEIEVDDPEVAERLRQLRNGYLRGEEVRTLQAAVDAERDELDQIATRLQVDPEGFLFENIPPQRAASVALQILAQEGVWSQVKNIIEGLFDDDSREVVRTRLENERLKNRDAAAQQYTERMQEAQSFRSAKEAIAVLIPEHLPEPQQVMLYQACQQDVRDAMERTGVRSLNPQDVAFIIAPRLREAGVDPLQVAASLRSPGQPRTSGQSSAPRATRAAQATTPTAQQVTQAATARRAMSMGAPTGTAPSAAGVARPPRGQTVQERIAWARENLRFGGA